MRYQNTLLTVASLVATARASIDFDLDDAPSVCRTTCAPIDDLANRCEVDLNDNVDDEDRQEDLLEAQCFCTNDSFDVRAVAALCRDCIRQNRDQDHDHDDDDDDRNRNGDNDRDDDRDDDGDNDGDDNRDGGGRRNGKAKRHDDDHDDAWKDINDIISICGFTSLTTSWASAMTSTASFTVTASAPTDAAQLTTTFSIDAQAATQTTDNNSNNNSNNNNNNNNNDDDDDDDDDDSAAVGVSAPLYLAGALVAGAMAFFI
jgi:hypothetical protein